MGLGYRSENTEVIPRHVEPIVSVGIAVYNGEDELPGLLESLVTQSYRNLEIIICDNASTDHTREVCDRFSSHDGRIRYIRNDVNIGAVGNFNKVVSEASGQYFMWAAADDVFHHDYIACCLRELESDDELVLVGAQTGQYIKDINRPLFVDEGVNLLEDDPWLRVMKYRDILLKRDHLGMIFYGLHRMNFLVSVLPLVECIGSDHLHVAAMAFNGKVKSIGMLLSWKRFGGASRSYKEIVKTLRNSAYIDRYIPFVKRELEFQRMIKAYSPGRAARIRRAFFSLYHFIKHNVLLGSRTGQRMNKLQRMGMRNIVLIILYYVFGKRRPWSRGYYAYKSYFLEKAINDPAMMSCFIQETPLPPRYGFRIDERAVEYLWAFSRLESEHQNIFDAGSALNFPFILNSRALQHRGITLCTLAPEHSHYKDARVSYIYDDLRNLMLRDNWFDAITCISTLEHVGMDNTLLYTNDDQHKASSNTDYMKVVKELRRILKPGGKLLITVPYGKYENHGWLQQFDNKMIDDVVRAFDGSSSNLAYFRYVNDGWDWAQPEECASDSYFDFHSSSEFSDDMLAAARSVACIELIK